MKENKRIDNDIRRATVRFPKLRRRWNEEQAVWILEGDLDICDIKGIYWDTFAVAILLDSKYPHSVPLVIETSEKIPRNSERHISKSGVCCLDIEHRLLHWAQRGIILSDFITEKVYPFFANQLYFEDKKCYAGDEYLHRFQGVQQFYSEELDITEPSQAILLIQAILNNRLPERNKLCPCNSMTKFKKCHQASVEFLIQVGIDQLKKDLQGFEEIRDSTIENI